MALILSQKKLLKEITQGTPLSVELSERKKKCSKLLLGRTFDNLNNLSRCNDETLASLSLQRLEKKRICRDLEQMDTRLRVIKIRQEKKLAEMHLMSSKVQQARLSSIQKM